MAPSKQTLFAAMFLVAGACIGAGMLALPVMTGLSGFLPSMAIMALSWAAMTITALLLIEVNLWMEEGAHIITMTSRILGTPGKIVSWIFYLFICYASIIAYADGGGHQIQDWFHYFTGIILAPGWGAAGFLLLYLSIYLGAQFVGKLNTVCFVAMIIAFFALIGMGIDEVKPDQLMHMKWGGTLMAIPIMLASFSFQTMVPSLTPYLKRHAPSLRWAVIGGTTITFLVYFVWEMIILGIIPVYGENGMAQILEQGEVPTLFLAQHVQGYWIVSIAKFFSFFALATSFLGFSLGLFDFLADGLKIPKTGWGRIVISLLIIVPTYICTVNFKGLFITALDTSGGFGDAILNGLMPVLMVWIGRYKLGYKSDYPTPGGKPLLVVVFAFYLLAVGVEIVGLVKA